MAIARVAETSTRDQEMAAMTTHKLLLFLKRRPGMSREAFRDYYEHQHMPMAMKYMAGPTRYMRRYLEPSPDMPEPDFDVITEIWFTDRKTLDMVIHAMAKDMMPPEVIADEEKLFDRSASRAYAVSEYETKL
jgi:EthD domain